MKKLTTIILLMLTSCGSYEGPLDGLILIDPNTKKKYMLEHNIGGNYFIKEYQIIISGVDSTKTFVYR